MMQLERPIQLKTVVILFLGFVFLGDRIVAFGLTRVALNSSLPLAQLYSGDGEADAIIVGNSRAYRHIDEQELHLLTGLKVRNLSLLAMGPKQAAALVADYIDRHGAPKVLLFETSALARQDGQVLNQRWLRRSSARFDSLLKAHDPTLYYAGQISHLVNLNSKGFVTALHAVLKPYQQIFLEGTSELIDNPDFPERYFEIKPEGLKAWEAVRNLSNEFGFPICLVLSPVHEVVRKRQVDFESSQLTTALAKELKQGIAVDAYELLDDDQYFYDDLHLNVEGKNQLMKHLADKLAGISFEN